MQESITQWLQVWRGGDEEAPHKLFPLVYAELKRLAQRHMNRERPGHTLQATGLVHEAYTRLIGSRPVDWRDRSHFYAVCSRIMRRVLVDYARSRAYLKRGGAVRLVSLQEVEDIGRDAEIILAVDEALTRLAEFDPRKSQVLEMRFFGGLTVDETAEVLGLSADTVTRDWKLAKAWMRRELAA